MTRDRGPLSQPSLGWAARKGEPHARRTIPLRRAAVRWKRVPRGSRLLHPRVVAQTGSHAPAARCPTPICPIEVIEWPCRPPTPDRRPLRSLYECEKGSGTTKWAARAQPKRSKISWMRFRRTTSGGMFIARCSCRGSLWSSSGGSTDSLGQHECTGCDSPIPRLL